MSKDRRSVFKKRCSENMQQVYRRTPMSKCDFNEVVKKIIEITLWRGCFPVNFLRTPLERCLCKEVDQLTSDLWRR